MAVLDYQSLMLPLLRLLGDGDIHRLREIIDTLGNELGLSPEESRQLLPSGAQRTFDNRVSWARTYMGKAGLLESVGRGTFRITPLGLDALKQAPARIDVNFLERFPGFVEFRARRTDREEKSTPEPESSQTPEEVLEASYQAIREELARDLLERVKACSPTFFERLVVGLLVAMGYGGSRKDAGEAIGQSGDEGVDGIIKEDKLGLDIVYVQAKRWDATVGRPIVQAFAGSLEGQRARKGVLITTSQFSPDARQYVEKIEKKIVLIDGNDLVQLMIDHDIGVNPEATYVVKKLDLDYFGEE